MLTSTVGSDSAQTLGTRRMTDLFHSMKIDVTIVDGSNPAEKEIRDSLFEVSGLRGKYPQCFIQSDDGSYKFIGLWEQVCLPISCLNTLFISRPENFDNYHQLCLHFICLFIYLFVYLFVCLFVCFLLGLFFLFFYLLMIILNLYT
jgi:hypothetical protein